jgi:hypothetical protein
MKWTPIWDMMIDSSIWQEPDHVFRVFVAMMILKSPTHVVWLDGYQIARRIHMPIEKVLDALTVLSEPDPRRPAQAHEGRRIRKVEGGWEVINGEKYQALMKHSQRQESNRKAQANWRARKAGKPLPFPKDGVAPDLGPSVEETAYDKALKNGDTEGAERIMELRNDADAIKYPPHKPSPQVAQDAGIKL